VVGNARTHVQYWDANTHAQSRDEITCTEMYVSYHKHLKVSYAFKRVEELFVFVFFGITFHENLYCNLRVLMCI